MKYVVRGNVLISVKKIQVKLYTLGFIQSIQIFTVKGKLYKH